MALNRIAPHREHPYWAPCGIEMKIKGIFKSWFWISLHQGMLSILYSRIQGYILSFMNEVDPCLLLPRCVLYEMQNQIFQHPTHFHLISPSLSLLSLFLSSSFPTLLSLFLYSFSPFFASLSPNQWLLVQWWHFGDGVLVAKLKWWSSLVVVDQHGSRGSWL